MDNPVYGYVTDRILEQLNQGVVPWKKPWEDWANPINYVSRKTYRGINLLLLPRAGEYLTKKQIVERHGRIKKGATSHMVTFYKQYMSRKNDDEAQRGSETGEKSDAVKYRYVLKYYRVFHLDDVEGIPTKIKENDIGHLADADRIIAEIPDVPKIEEQNLGRAAYIPSRDVVVMPPRASFRSAAEYYSTLFHELVHSTGHPDRLARKGIMELSEFGSDQYSREELVAEIGSSMLMAVTGHLDDVEKNNTAYIQHWIARLNDDKTLIVHAASQAGRAVEYILNQEVIHDDEEGVTEET